LEETTTVHILLLLVGINTDMFGIVQILRTACDTERG
jgi:hypothetical protein